MGNLFRPRVTHQTTQVNKQNPYDDSWIKDRFGTAEQQYAKGQSQIDELTKFMNERKAALAKPQTVSIGGQNVRQDQLGDYLQNQINTRASDLNRQLVEYQTGVDQSINRLGQQGSQARNQLMSTYDARLADIQSAAGARDTRLQNIMSAAGARDQQLAGLQTAASERDAALLGLQTEAGQLDRRLADITTAAGQRDAKLADITSAAGANQAAIRSQQEALSAQGERARANEEANRLAIQAATDRNQASIEAATTQYKAGQQANQAAIRAQQEQMAQQTQAARAAQEQNKMTAGVKADLKPVNKYRFGTAGSFNRAGLRISSLNI
jgi:chromosome segregation ATPase